MTDVCNFCEYIRRHQPEQSSHEDIQLDKALDALDMEVVLMTWMYAMCKWITQSHCTMESFASAYQTACLLQGVSNKRPALALVNLTRDNMCVLQKHLTGRAWTTAQLTFVRTTAPLLPEWIIHPESDRTLSPSPMLPLFLSVVPTDLPRSKLREHIIQYYKAYIHEEKKKE